MDLGTLEAPFIHQTTTLHLLVDGQLLSYDADAVSISIRYLWFKLKRKSESKTTFTNVKGPLQSFSLSYQHFFINLIFSSPLSLTQHTHTHTHTFSLSHTHFPFLH